MAKRMLIDATHAEETRVVVLDGNRLEDFDVETAAKQHLKGNIYLAKVVRVEPSLQAAFVEYGGGRHGFLAFGEIHPDYYQIPVADRQRLLEMQAEEARREEEEEDRAAAEAEASGGWVPETVPETVPGSDATYSEAGDLEAADPEAAGEAEYLAHEAEVTTPVEAAHVAAAPEPAPVAADAPAAVDPAPVAEVAAPEAPAATTPAAEAPHEEPEPPATRAQPLSIPVDRVDGPVPEDAPQPVPVPLDADQPDIAAPVLAAGETDQPDIAGDIPGELALEPGEEFDAEPQPAPETMGGDTSEDGGDDRSERRIPPRFLRNYKIQEVIKRRQILLVQVVKEERGTKGAALTTYISLAGRYSVLMPNSPRGGGISRKITSAADRRRLKEVTAELDLPKGMGLIVRTAGANRPKPEIKRDCEYLLRLWDDIREHTMRSVAPAQIYEEANLIKRVIRDVYSRDVDEVVIDGQEGWKAARDYMRMLMPSHAKKVILWQEPGQSLFAKHGVEAQLDSMLSPTVQLKSGGYLVINQAEALVAIDVNSGRSTRERNIEETALRTNLEAADEVARQLRLRDLAGLIVIDFIDMDQRRHNGMVERRLKEALKNDRARIQLGSISHFGLLEMSRQRLRPSLAETTLITCPHCNGTGHVRGTESSALHVLRHVEEEGSKRRAAEIVVHVAGAIALYILNNKRQRLADIEARYGMRVSFAADETLIPPGIRIERVRALVPSEAPLPVLPAPLPAPIEPEEEEAVEEAEPIAAAAGNVAEEAEDADGDEARPGETAGEAEQRRRRRRRRRRGGRREDGEQAVAGAEEGAEGAPMVADDATVTGDTTIAGEADVLTPDVISDQIEAALAEHIEGVPEHLEPVEAPAEPAADGEGGNRRRGRRGGRRRRRDDDPALVAVREPGAEQPEVPAWTGPTPADPFGGQNFDIFDVLERAEQAAEANATPEATAEPAPSLTSEAPAAEPVPEVVAGPTEAAPVEVVPVEAVPVEAVPAEAVPVAIASAEVAAAEPVAAPPAAVEPDPAPAPVAAEPGAVEPEAAAPEPEARAEPVVKPIVIGVDEVAAPKKRGWWRR